MITGINPNSDFVSHIAPNGDCFHYFGQVVQWFKWTYFHPLAGTPSQMDRGASISLPTLVSSILTYPNILPCLVVGFCERVPLDQPIIRRIK